MLYLVLSEKISVNLSILTIHTYHMKRRYHFVTVIPDVSGQNTSHDHNEEALTPEVWAKSQHWWRKAFFLLSSRYWDCPPKRLILFFVKLKQFLFFTRWFFVILTDGICSLHGLKGCNWCYLVVDDHFRVMSSKTSWTNLLSLSVNALPLNRASSPNMHL